MNAYVEEWLQALESGEYQQTRGMLTAVDSSDSLSHCCLGLVCHLNKSDLFVKPIGSISGLQYDDIRTYLPEAIRTKLGFRHASGEFFVDATTKTLLLSIKPSISVDEGEKVSLITLNDNLEFTFKEIAQVIRSKPPGLFVEQE